MKGILAAKKKPVEAWALADLGLDATSVGLEAAWSKVLQTTPRPPKEPGRVLQEEDGVPALIDFLAAGKYI
jgi:electron transfer flavoprotein beta subunit